MKNGLLIPLLFVLTACNMPSLAFSTIEPVRVVIEQSTFDVRISGTTAEAIRVNTEYAPNLASVAPRAIRAIEQVSGCPVVPGSLGGDQAVIRAEVLCDG